MRKSFVLVFLLLASNLSFLSAQVQEEWVARYDGPPSLSDYATAMAIDAAGNVYVTGKSITVPAGWPDWDYATVKYDVDGNQQWVARYNGPGNNDDIPFAIAVDAAGNVYVTGLSWGVGTNRDYATIKYDADGNQLWVVRYNGPGNREDAARAIAIDAEGNVYVTGLSYGGPSTGWDYATIKYDADGNQQWVARYNGPGNQDDEAKAIALDAEGNVYVTGLSVGVGTGFDYATIKYDADGNQQWVARYNGPGNGWDAARAIALDAEANVYVTGGSEGVGTQADYATIKYDADGNQQWVARYNGPGNAHDAAEAIAIDAEANVYVTGESMGAGTGLNYATIKYDADGNQQWVARYNGPTNLGDEAHAIAIDAEANVYVTGQSMGVGTELDYATIKYDAAGNQQWVARYNGPGNNADIAEAIAIDAEANVYVTGGSVGDGTMWDYATIKYSQK